MGISEDAKLILNARVEMTPEDLDSIVAEVLNKVCGDKINKEVNALKCLSGYSKASHRLMTNKDLVYKKLRRCANTVTLSSSQDNRLFYSDFTVYWKSI